MSKKLRTEAVDHLFDAILCLKNKEECYTFFEDVCTVNELLSLSIWMNLSFFRIWMKFPFWKSLFDAVHQSYFQLPFS